MGQTDKQINKLIIEEKETDTDRELEKERK